MAIESWDTRWALLALVLACGDSSGTTEFSVSGTGATVNATATTAGPTTATVTSASATATTSGTGTGTASASSAATTMDAKFDLGLQPDAGGPAGPVIPETCEQAAGGDSSVGCTFYTVDLDNNLDSVQFALVVANVQLEGAATVTVERRSAGVWSAIAGPQPIGALSLHSFEFPDFHFEDAGLNPEGAYRVTSDLPVIAYQFNPIDGANSTLSDASMLYPVPAWDDVNHVVNLAGGDLGDPYFVVVASIDGTQVEITPSVATLAGPGVPAQQPGEPTVLALDDGDTASIYPASQLNSLTGSLVISDPDHPVAVLSGHSCANIPGDTCCCDHLEEQVAGVRQWGKSFIAPHMPYREPADPETTLWQVYASEDDATVNFAADPAVTGLPGAQLTLQSGEVLEFHVGAPAGVEADFAVDADKPIAVFGYQTGSFNLNLQDKVGDPAMVQFPPSEQFLPRYVVLVPGTWEQDALILTRPAGATITVDDVPVPDSEFTPVGPGVYEAARISVPDGVHVLDGGEDGFGVVVVGWDAHDSYGYIGGIGTAAINPNPQG